MASTTSKLLPARAGFFRRHVVTTSSRSQIIPPPPPPPPPSSSKPQLTKTSQFTLNTIITPSSQTTAVVGPGNRTITTITTNHRHYHPSIHKKQRKKHIPESSSSSFESDNKNINHRSNKQFRKSPIGSTRLILEREDEILSLLQSMINSSNNDKFSYNTDARGRNNNDDSPPLSNDNLQSLLDSLGHDLNKNTGNERMTHLLSLLCQVIDEWSGRCRDDFFISSNSREDDNNNGHYTNNHKFVTFPERAELWYDYYDKLYRHWASAAVSSSSSSSDGSFFSQVASLFTGAPSPPTTSPSPPSPPPPLTPPDAPEYLHSLMISYRHIHLSDGVTHPSFHSSSNETTTSLDLTTRLATDLFRLWEKAPLKKDFPKGTKMVLDQFARCKTRVWGERSRGLLRTVEEEMQEQNQPEAEEGEKPSEEEEDDDVWWGTVMGVLKVHAAMGDVDGLESLIETYVDNNPSLSLPSRRKEDRRMVEAYTILLQGYASRRNYNNNDDAEKMVAHANDIYKNRMPQPPSSEEAAMALAQIYIRCDAWDDAEKFLLESSKGDGLSMTKLINTMMSIMTTAGYRYHQRTNTSFNNNSNNNNGVVDRYDTLTKWMFKYQIPPDDQTFNFLFTILSQSTSPDQGPRAELLLSQLEAAHLSHLKFPKPNNNNNNVVTVNNPPRRSHFEAILQAYLHDVQKGLPRAASKIVSIVDRMEATVSYYEPMDVVMASGAAATAQTRAYNAAINACASVVRAEEKRRGLDDALEIYKEWMRLWEMQVGMMGRGGGGGGGPNAITYSCLLSAVANTGGDGPHRSPPIGATTPTTTASPATNDDDDVRIPEPFSETERFDIVTRIFDDACRLGQVNDIVLLQLKRACYDVFKNYERLKEHGKNVNGRLSSKDGWKMKGVGGGNRSGGGKGVAEMQQQQQAGAEGGRR